MGDFNTLMARDGHEFQAYLAAPEARARGAVVVLQDIFGVTAQIRSVADSYAAQGYVAIAPALFDRVRRGIELDNNEKTMQEGTGYTKQLERAAILKDVAACVAVVKHAGRVGTLGFGWGGGISYLAACELPVAAAVCYFGDSIPTFMDKKPKCPVLYQDEQKSAALVSERTLTFFSHHLEPQ